MSLGNVGVDAPVGDSYKHQWKALSGWFLGPRGENHDVFLDTFKALLEKHVELRNNYFPADPAYITDEVRKSYAFECEVQEMKDVLLQASVEMGGNVPFFSPRYQAHMNWDTTLPSVLGYMSAMLFNPNNVDSAASPVTTLYEQTVGKQLCKMLGYNIDSDKSPIVGWGHVTCGGSIANIEALWASRNLKFTPLSVRNALENQEARKILTPAQIRKGLSTEVTVFDETSQELTGIPLKNCTKWQLLNMDVDEICSLADDVVKNMEVKDNSIESQFKTIIETESVVNLGLFDFMKKNGLEKSPMYTCPANNHYSWPKGGTILGIGSDALIPIGLDKNFRQDINALEEKLMNCLENEIPVISVTAVIGSTEESAVDAIKEMYDLREEFKEKGLNFALLADAAWGGYFKTMVHGTAGTEEKNRDRGFVPHCPLTPYVEEQYKNLQLADTITVDPHKSGFCPYPGGALCYRNGKMRYSIAVFHPEVFHGADDPTMGVYGIEGSKPGAAPAGILMSHNVIGLDNNGYGRILGQCTTTTKLFYCVWLTVARDDDPFVCVPLQDLPVGYTMESAKKLIKETMAYKSMSEVYNNNEAFEFLQACGPDTMINTFGVNLKGNKDIELTNELQIALSDAMSINVGSSAKSVPLIIMQSGFDAKKHGEGLTLFKEKLGLPKESVNDLNVMVNSCMNPWQSNESIFLTGNLFRLIVLNCIGRLQDEAVKHRFIVVSDIDPDDNTIFMEYVTDMSAKEHQYQVSVKVEVERSDTRSLKKQEKNSSSAIVFETVGMHNLYLLLHKPEKEGFEVFGSNGDAITLHVVDVPRYQKLDRSSTVIYPKHQTYFIYGDEKRTMMSHVISELPDFQQTVTLSNKPHSLSPELLDLGVMVNLTDIEGRPLVVGGEIVSPLQRASYDITFKGELFSTIKTGISIDDGDVYFKAITA